MHPSLSSCGVLLGDTPHPCETTGHKMKTRHSSGPNVHARSVTTALLGGCCAHLAPEYGKNFLPSPPLSFPTPCRSPGGGGGPSLGQPKIFRCSSLCCCVGDCVMGHCHLYPLRSWQDILLTFAEMELDSTTMFPPGTSVMFIRSTGKPVLDLS